MMQTSLARPAVLYVRFSESRQADGDSIKRQTKNAQAYCQSHGLAIVRTITDKGKSAYHGLHISNGELGKFLAEVDAGAYQNHVFLIEEVDRLSRAGNKTASDLQLRLFAGGMEIHEFKTGLVLTGPDDLDSLDKGLVSTLRNSLAKDESRKRSLRLLSVRNSEREQAAQNGLAFTSRCPAWLKAQIGAKPVEIRKYCDTVRYIFDLAGQGLADRNLRRPLRSVYRGARLPPGPRYLNRKGEPGLRNRRRTGRIRVVYG